jgi:hypothetical protein
VRARLVTAAAAALLGALGSTVMLALLFALWPRLQIEFGVVHPAERGNYLFPYAPGLYVATLRFADMVRRLGLETWWTTLR